MGRVFYNKKFSDYLGENRAILDIIESYIPDGSPVPSPTPSVTPSNTPTPSVTTSNTPTPTITPTRTLIPTSTPTTTPTPTTTTTQTPTPTSTTVPACDITYVLLPTPTPTNTSTPTPTPSATPAPPFDIDATLYLNAVVSAGGSVDATMSAATDTLFTELKSNNLYNKLQIFYPLIGGTSSSHSIMGNRASGTTYDIVWGGAMTHSVSGITGVGAVNSWGDLGLYGSGTTLGDRHWSLYSFVNNLGAAYDLASDENGIILGYGGSNWYGMFDQTNYDPMSAPNTTGMYVAIEPSLNTQRNFRNGSLNGNYSRTSYRYDLAKFAIGAKNSGAGQVKSEYSSRGYSWISLGYGLTDGEATTLTTIINTFQTTLGRNVY